MAIMIADCPRCGAEKMTFDVTGQTRTIAIIYDWQRWFEVFSICRHCHKSTVFEVSQKDIHVGDEIKKQNWLVERTAALNIYVDVKRFINISDFHRIPSPDHVSPDIARVFDEGAACVAISCWNAAGTMFRLCVDLATKRLLPEGEVEGLNAKTRRDLGLRLPWLFDNRYLPDGLRELSKCIHQDGNDAAHQGTLTEADAHDLLDFTIALLHRLYTEPEKLRLAEQRRADRRTPKQSG
jgi:hypothetical protein